MAKSDLDTGTICKSKGLTVKSCRSAEDVENLQLHGNTVGDARIHTTAAKLVR